MTSTPMAFADSLRIGAVEFVSPDKIEVILDIEAPESVALNTGTPHSFPRVNSYLLIPVDNIYVVGQVEWVTVERSQAPLRKGVRESGLLDVPYPVRKLNLSPLGALTLHSPLRGRGVSYSFERGVTDFPTIGDPVLTPTVKQLKAIVESGSNRRVSIGTSPLAADAEVMVDPDRLFGRHLAVLGNTGSGKSCSVAGLIRWSVEAAREERGGSAPNARFLILDPNGEYSTTFTELGANVYSVDAPHEDEQMLVPFWLWNSEEWAAFTQASSRMQRPLLKRALRDVKSGDRRAEQYDNGTRIIRRDLTSQFVKIKRDVDSNIIRDQASKFGHYLKSVLDDIIQYGESYPAHKNLLSSIESTITEALESTYASFTKSDGEIVGYYNSFSRKQLRPIVAELRVAINSLGGPIGSSESSEDLPIQFDINELSDHYEQLGIQENSTQFTDFLVSRIREVASNAQLRNVSHSDTQLSLRDWLERHFGSTATENQTTITVLDLSLLPAESVHLITAVIARMTLEALQRYRKLNNGEVLPSVLVMEEAHNFITRRTGDNDTHGAQNACSAIFEKIAREGRKFGLGLLISSQRPSELSPTVLSQCNSFLLHRLSNHLDQDLVQRLVPDNLRGLLRDLPTLPSQHAVLLGWASELPISVKIRSLPKEHRPQSDDPDFWRVWAGQTHSMSGVPESTDWGAIADDWVGI